MAAARKISVVLIRLIRRTSESVRAVRNFAKKVAEPSRDDILAKVLGPLFTFQAACLGEGSAYSGPTQRAPLGGIALNKPIGALKL